jgi:homoserine dehydrogenase
MFFGRGAGGVPTASAVLGDVVSAARHRVLGGKSPEESTYAELPVADHARTRTRFQVRVLVDDRSGVLTQVAGVFAAHDVSIENVRQVPDGAPGAVDHAQVAELLITTHLATESAFDATVRAVSDLAVVREVTSTLRVEGV